MASEIAGGRAGRLPAPVVRLRGLNWWLRASFALLFALYVRTVAFAPVYDDNRIGSWTAGWRDIPNFFTHDIFGTNSGAHSVYYRPLATTWGFLVGTVTGSAPGWLHLQAVLMHVAVVGLAFVFGRLLFRDEAMALVTALLFGLHPSKVESVAWIGSSYVDALGGVLFFATLIAFLKWRESDARRWWAASVAFCAAALFTKETMVAIPILLAAYLWWFSPSRQPLTSRLTEILRALWPFAIVSAVYFAIRHQVIRPAPSTANYVHPTYTPNYLWTAPHAFWWYASHLLMPWGLSVDYGKTACNAPTLRAFVLPGLAIGALLLASWWLWRRRRSKIALFLGFWFVLNLAPPVLLAPMVSVHDRYLYLSSYAFCALVACTLLRAGALPARARLALVLAVVAACSALTWHETSFWEDDSALWHRALAITPSNTRARVQVAVAENVEGDPARALAVLSDGLRYDQDSPRIWMVRAVILSGLHRDHEAKAAYRKVIEETADPTNQSVPPGVRIQLRAQAAYQLSLLAASAGEFSQGERDARLALELDHEGASFHAALAQNLAGEGRLEEARHERETEIRLRIAEQRRNADTHP